MNIKPFRYLLDSRDRSIIEFDLPMNPPGTARTILLWDADRDGRLITLLEALRYRSPMMLPAVTAITETRGTVDFWCPATADAVVVTRALQAAADAAIQPRDKWHINSPTGILVSKGRLVWSGLAPSDPVRTVIERVLAGKFPELSIVQDGSVSRNVRS